VTDGGKQCTCTVVEVGGKRCTNPVLAGGLCNMHYTRRRRQRQGNNHVDPFGRRSSLATEASLLAAQRRAEAEKFDAAAAIDRLRNLLDQVYGRPG
jgi:hypothetical protein